MTYQVIPGTSVPTIALTLDFSFSLVGWVLVGLLCCGFGILAWYASADWRASVTPAWWPPGSSRLPPRSELPESTQQSLQM
jgi:hypothetical protein